MKKIFISNIPILLIKIVKKLYIDIYNCRVIVSFFLFQLSDKSAEPNNDRATDSHKQIDKLAHSTHSFKNGLYF